MNPARLRPTTTAAAIAMTIAGGLAVAPPAAAYQSNLHVFSVDDVLGGFDGSTYGDGGVVVDKSIICGLPDSAETECPAGAAQPFTDRSGVTLYPVDSEYGFYVVNFVGAEAKVRDGDYGEGWVGNLPDGSGLALSNAVTDRYKVPPPLGTWCQGLGGNSVKCSTEHYTVMEHVTTCHEVVPYFYADPISGDQGTLSAGTLSVDCGTTALDDELLILANSTPTERLVDATPGAQMAPNDNTSVVNDIAVSSDYSLTLKDDGKPLYRWGALIKRPNDLRVYARLTLPEEWKTPDPVTGELPDYEVTKAWLVINHTITNNPNDQVRPEDLENEAAIGVLPDHVIENLGTEDEIWRSTKLCYEGDGDLIDTEDGTSDPTVLGVGTFLKNGPFALDPDAMPGTDPVDPPYAFSEDLTEGLTNAWFTTIDREPFEWSYAVITDDLDEQTRTVDYRGCPGPIEDPAYAALCTNVPADAPLFSGPRWRLKPNKFGQNLPGLEIPTTAGLEEACTPPPFSRGLIKYEVGAPTVTVLNMLDWDEAEGGPSPLASSRGWVDADANDFIEIVDEINDNGDIRKITTLGAPMSEDFDLLIYVKGDRKPTFLYNAQLVLEYEGEVPAPADEADMAMTQLTVPLKVSGQQPDARVKDITVEACNNGPAEAAGVVSLTGVSLVPGVATVGYAHVFSGLASGACTSEVFSWTAPDIGTSITWTAEVTVSGDLVDPVADNNSADGTTLVYPYRK
ncbi:hypothetical protein [uncultured Thiohalocapsa sp.]|uniref:hypothetical protein n=1 Tax=uncultured Thiohalocapsa sp. TaxID=768990 RepID=UPI0025DE5B6A|nr:hypothetical protein [uncultured Thiohalocapsa sp.]